MVRAESFRASSLLASRDRQSAAGGGTTQLMTDEVAAQDRLQLVLHASPGQPTVAYAFLSEGVVQCGQLSSTDSVADALRSLRADHVLMSTAPAAALSAAVKATGATTSSLPFIEFSAANAIPNLEKLIGARGLIRASARDDAGNTENQSFLYLHSKFNSSSPLILGAVSALCFILRRNNANCVVVDIADHSLDVAMAVDERTLRAIGITRKEAHPAGYQGIGAPKEGLSIYGLLLHRARSAIGRTTLLRWLQSPSRDATLINQRLDAVGFLSAPENQPVLIALQRCMKFIKPPGPIIARIAESKYSAADWDSLCCLCLAYTDTVGILQQHGLDRWPIFQPLVSRCDSAALTEMADCIMNTIDLTTSVNGGLQACVVKQGVNAELDEYRATFGEMDKFLTAVVKREVEALPVTYQHAVHAAFFPQIGYVVALGRDTVPLDASGANYDVPSGWEYSFGTEGSIYFKTPTLRDLDEKVGDVHSYIVDIELRVVRELEERVKATGPHLLAGVHSCATVDALVAMASMTAEAQWVRPEILPDGGEFVIRGAHHPLVRGITAPIPNDFVAHATTGRVAFLTGPNGSGKTVYLKSLLIVSVLAHVGCFVPAESATISVMDAVFTNLLAEDPSSVAQRSVAVAPELSSSFAKELVAVGRALHNSTSRSIVLLDEFGKGTLAADGIALFVSVLEKFMSCPESCPIVLVATHYTEVLDRQLLQRTSLLQYLTMDFRITGSSLDDISYMFRAIRDSSFDTNQHGRSVEEVAEAVNLFGEEAVSFRAEAGVADPSCPPGPRSSFAAAVAKKCDLPDGIVERMSVVERHLRAGVPIPPRSGYNNDVLQCVERVWKLSLDLVNCGEASRSDASDMVRQGAFDQLIKEVESNAAILLGRG